MTTSEQLTPLRDLITAIWACGADRAVEIERAIADQTNLELRDGQAMGIKAAAVEQLLRSVCLARPVYLRLTPEHAGLGEYRVDPAPKFLRLRWGRTAAGRSHYIVTDEGRIVPVPLLDPSGQVVLEERPVAHLSDLLP